MNLKPKENYKTGISKFSARNIVESRPKPETGEPFQLNLLKPPGNLNKVLQKSRSDYENKLNSIFKNAGMGITSSAKKLGYVSTRINLEDISKSNENKSSHMLKSQSERPNKVSFAINTPKFTPAENPTNLLNQEIEDFERRLEEYRNTMRNKDQFKDLYKVSYSRFS